MESADSSSVSSSSDIPDDGEWPDVALFHAGLESPPMRNGQKASIPDDAELIGVALPGGARAYLVSAMTTVDNHIINEVVDGVPHTVTYCNRTGCARVFTKSGSQSSLKLMVGGLRGGKLLVGLDGFMYVQDDPAIPLPELAFTRTTWKEWIDRHPDTLVYVGNQIL